MTKQAFSDFRSTATSVRGSTDVRTVADWRTRRDMHKQLKPGGTIVLKTTSAQPEPSDNSRMSWTRVLGNGVTSCLFHHYL